VISSLQNSLNDEKMISENQNNIFLDQELEGKK
jgi:hypothetical protein